MGSNFKRLLCSLEVFFPFIPVVFGINLFKFDVEFLLDLDISLHVNSKS